MRLIRSVIWGVQSALKLRMLLLNFIPYSINENNRYFSFNTLVLSKQNTNCRPEEGSIMVETAILVTCYLLLTGVEAAALIAPSAAFVEPVLECCDSVSFDDMCR